MKCWSCGLNPFETLERHQENSPSSLKSYPSENKVSFRAECEKCGVWLHCCFNCVFYQPGLSNDCKIPHTEYVRDRTSLNFCEDFKGLGLGPQNKKESAQATFDSLFKS